MSKIEVEGGSESQKTIFLVAQKDPKVDQPMRPDIYDIGVLARVIQNLKLPNGNVKVMVEGLQRAKLLETPSVAEDVDEPLLEP